MTNREFAFPRKGAIQSSQNSNKQRSKTTSTNMKVIPFVSIIFLASYQLWELWGRASVRHSMRMSQEHRMLRRYHGGLRSTKEKGNLENCELQRKMCELSIQEDKNESTASCMDCIQEVKAIWDRSIRCAHNASSIIHETCHETSNDDLTQKYMMCAYQQSQIGCSEANVMLAIVVGVVLAVLAVIVLCLADSWVRARRHQEPNFICAFCCGNHYSGRQRQVAAEHGHSQVVRVEKGSSCPADS